MMWLRVCKGHSYAEKSFILNTISPELVERCRIKRQLCFDVILRVTNLSVSVDVPPAPSLVLLPPLLLRGHLHLPQVYPPPPGGDVTDSHSHRTREQRGVWRDQAAGGAPPGAQVRERDGAEVPA